MVGAGSIYDRRAKTKEIRYVMWTGLSVSG